MTAASHVLGTLWKLSPIFFKLMNESMNESINRVFLGRLTRRQKETGIDEIFKIHKIVIGGASKPMTGYVFSLKANKHLAY